MLELREYAAVPEAVFLLEKPGHVAAGAHIFQVALAAYGQRMADDELLDCRHGLDLLADPCVDLLPETGHAAHQVGMHCVDGLGDDARVIIDGDRHSARYAEIAPGLLEDVRHRQESHRQVGVLDGMEDAEMLLYGRVIVRMGYRHALGLAGGARGIDQRGHVLGQAALRAFGHEADGLLVGLHAEPHEIIPEDSHRVVVVQLKSVVFEDNDASHAVGMLLPMVVGHGILVLVAHEEHGGASVGDNEVKLRLHAARIYRDACQAVAERAELRDEDLRRVGRAYGYCVLLVEAERGEGL